MSAYSVLVKVSTPKAFKADEYICYEGQVGHEMYIVLKGSVGIYITSAVGTQTEVAVLHAGNFFGEMAIFDNKPRSASCVALEDTLCVAVTKKMLPKFIVACPDITMAIIESMSERVRKLNDELYKSEKSTRTRLVADFAIPDIYDRSHSAVEPRCDAKYIEQLDTTCPVCGSNIMVPNVKRKNITLLKVDDDYRKHYDGCEPLWYNVWSCPNCQYSNYYLRFFGLSQTDRDTVSKLLEEKQMPVIEKAGFLNTAFDRLFVKYLQAININEAINGDDNLLLGTLWQNLYWLFEDAKDEKMRFLCAGKAAGYLREAYSNDNVIPDAYSRQTIAMMIASLYAYTSQKDLAIEYCDEASEYSDERIKEQAYMLKEKIMRDM